MLGLAVCLLVATGAVEPLLTRSFSYALVHYHAEAGGFVGDQVSLRTVSSAVVPTSTLERWVDPRVRAVTGSPTVSTTAPGELVAKGLFVSLQYTKGACSHVHLVSGRCPAARGEVMVSEATRKQAGLGEVDGRRPFALDMGRTRNDGIVVYDVPTRVRIVGVFKASTTDAFWGGIDPGRFVANPNGGPAATLLTSGATFAGQVSAGGESGGQWSTIATSVAYPLSSSKLTPRSLPAAVDGIDATAKHDVQLYESISQIDEQTHTDLSQVGQILPLLLVQLGLVLLILLVQVWTFLATARRGEAAVLKMRGNGARGVVRVGAQELVPACVIGAVGGLAVAYGVDEVVRVLWLPGDVAAAWLWTPLLAAGCCLIGALLVGAVCWWLVAREPISALLRARPPRQRGVRISTPLAVVAALCLLAVVLTATKSLSGASVQVTPVSMAALVAIVVSVLLAPFAARLVRVLLRRGQPAGALAVAQLGRRSGVTVALATLIITAALFTLSVSVYSRGVENRAARTAADLGAAAVVHADPGTGSPHGQNLIDAVDSVDPQHRYFAPAVLINAATPTSNAVLGVVPAEMQRISTRTGLRQQVPWSALGSGTSKGRPAALVSTSTTKAAVGSVLSAPTMADVDGTFTVVGSAPYIPGVGARTIVVDLATMLKAGPRQDNVTYQVFSTTQDRARLAKLERAVRKAGFGSVQVQTSESVRAGYDATAVAWAMSLNIVISVLAVLAALASVVLVAVASRTDRARDLRALRTGGLSQRVLLAATVGEFVLLAGIGGAIGAATAPVAAWLTGGTMLWWSTPPDQPLTRTGFQWAYGSAAAVALLALLLVIAAIFGARIARANDRGTGGPT